MVRFNVMAQAHTADWQALSSGVVATSVDAVVPELLGDAGVDGPGGGEIVTAKIERADQYDLHGSVAGF